MGMVAGKTQGGRSGQVARAVDEGRGRVVVGEEPGVAHCAHAAGRRGHACEGPCLLPGEAGAQGRVAFLEGEPHENHYYLAEGLVEVFTVDCAGRKKSVDFYRPGSFFGFQILLDDNLPMTTARACEDSLLLAIPKDSYFKALHGCPDFADVTVRNLFGLLAMQTREVINSSFYVAAQRVPLLLLELARDAQEAGAQDEEGIVLPYGNGEIAEMLGVSRNSVTASVSRLQSQGVVEKRRNSMRVVDLDKLREIAYLERE